MKTNQKGLLQRIVAIALLMTLILSSTPVVNSFAQDSNTVASINFDTVGKKDFTDLNDKLSKKVKLGDQGSWIFKKYFMGWSENKNYAREKTGNFYFADSPVKDVYPNGFDPSKIKTLYPIYAGIGELSGAKGNSIYLNKDMTPAETLLDTTIKSSTGFDNNDTDKEVIGYVDPAKSKYDLVLNTSFKMDPIGAMLAFKNPGGILVNSGTWTDGPKQGASYSHVDLHIKIDSRVKVADVIKNLSFKSYNFKPEMLLDKDYKLLQGGLGKHITKGNPITTFDANVAGNNEFILRTTIRRDGNANNVLQATPQEVMSDMTLSTSSIDAFTIPKDVADTLATSGEKLVINGFIDGIMKASRLPMRIPVLNSKVVKVGFAHPTVDITVKKNWEGIAPDKAPEVKIVLVKNGEKTDQSMVLNKDNNWTGEFKEMPKINPTNNSNNVYTLWEEGEDNGKLELSGNKYNVVYDNNTVTNTLVKKPIPVPTPGTSATKATAIIANGSKYTDVLTATVLANERSCPILLVDTDNITKETMDELHRRGIGDVIISGGTSSVSEKVVAQLHQFNVIRYSGKDRYETAKAIGDEVRRLSKHLSGSVLVDGTNFPDVITISALATQKRVPILLTAPKELTETTATTIKEWNVGEITIGGQKSSVSENVEKSVKSLVGSVARIGGSDRFETASLIGAEVRKNSSNKTDMILVDGTNFPDGITVNSLAAKFSCPVHLTRPSTLPEITASDIKNWNIENILITGGVNSVSDNIYNSLNVKNKERISGTNRYSTAVKISQKLDQSKLVK